MAPWKGPRHRSPFSDTNIAIAAAAIVVAVYLAWELAAAIWHVGHAPQGIVTLVGVAGGALFGAVSGDKKKRDADVVHRAEDAEKRAVVAEEKADRAVEVAEAAVEKNGGSK